MSDETFTCPRCGRTSHNPNDVKYGYCGACHDYTGEDNAVIATLPEGYRPTYGLVILGLDPGIEVDEENVVVTLGPIAVDNIRGWQPAAWMAGGYSGRFTSETNPVEEVDPADEQ